MYTVSQLFDLEHTLASSYLSRFKWPWEALAGIKDFILQFFKLSLNDLSGRLESVFTALDLRELSSNESTAS